MDFKTDGPLAENPFMIFRAVFLFSASAFLLSSCSLWSDGRKREAQHIESLGCDPQFDAAEISAQRTVVPVKLYHFAKKDFLKKDIKNKYFTTQGWRQSLVDPEWGLHVADGIDSAQAPPGSDVLIEVNILPECQNPSKVGTLLNLEKDPRFQVWFKKLPESSRNEILTLKDFEKICDVKQKVGLDGYADFRCRRLALQFLNETKIAILQDHQNNKNFYIRSLACVESVRGSAEDILQILTNQDFWAAPCLLERLTSYTPFLLAHGLAESSLPPTYEQREHLLQNVGLIRQESVRLELAKMLKGYDQCERTGRLKKFQKSVEELNLKLSDGENFLWTSKSCPGQGL